MNRLTLTCPIRGVLKTGKKSADGLKPTEEYYRVEAIRYLLSKGYPKDHIKVEATVKRFGNSGRNSMRADIAVLDCPSSMIATGDVDALLDHAIVLVEVKREANPGNYVQKTQVEPLLDFARLSRCIAVYWDNIDQRVFWSEQVNGRRATKSGPITLLPKYGQEISLKPIKPEELEPEDNLIDVFNRIEDILHAASIDLDQRYDVMMQMIIAKLFDEHKNKSKSTELEIQDYRSLGYRPEDALNQFNALLLIAANYYKKHLPKPVSPKLPARVNGDVLMDICQILAPVCLTASRRDVIQNFYMRFSKGLYKWDLAQYFTPPTVTDYIIDILNPQFGEHIKDPACGSADFLTAAFHKRRDFDPNYAECIWGVDKSDNAVQVGVLNMLLNGDGKSGIQSGDSLQDVDKWEDQFDILVCNPPFGLRIVEKRPAVLRKFDLGHGFLATMGNG